jgi:hypothetical protein
LLWVAGFDPGSKVLYRNIERVSLDNTAIAPALSNVLKDSHVNSKIWEKLEKSEPGDINKYQSAKILVRFC